LPTFEKGELPNQTETRSQYQLTADEFEQSTLQCAKISCETVQEAEKMRKGFYFPLLNRPIKVIRRKHIIYLMKEPQIEE